MKNQENQTIKTKCGRAGHDVRVDSSAGFFFCISCGHHILTDAERVAEDLLETLELVEELVYNGCKIDNGYAIHQKIQAVIARAKGGVK